MPIGALPLAWAADQSAKLPCARRNSSVAVAPRMVALRHISRILVLEVPDPVSCLSGLDAAIRSLEPEGVDTLVAAMIAVIDPVAGEITWANAGLPGPMVRHPEGTVQRLTGGNGQTGRTIFGRKPQIVAHGP